MTRAERMRLSAAFTSSQQHPTNILKHSEALGSTQRTHQKHFRDASEAVRSKQKHPEAKYRKHSADTSEAPGSKTTEAHSRHVISIQKQ